MLCVSMWQCMQVLRDAHSLAALKQDTDAEANASTEGSAATPFAVQIENEKVRSCAGVGQDSCQAVWLLRCHMLYSTHAGRHVVLQHCCHKWSE